MVYRQKNSSNDGQTDRQATPQPQVFIGMCTIGLLSSLSPGSGRRSAAKWVHSLFSKRTHTRAFPSLHLSHPFHIYIQYKHTRAHLLQLFVYACCVAGFFSFSLQSHPSGFKTGKKKIVSRAPPGWQRGGRFVLCGFVVGPAPCFTSHTAAAKQKQQAASCAAARTQICKQRVQRASAREREREQECFFDLERGEPSVFFLRVRDR